MLLVISFNQRNLLVLQKHYKSNTNSKLFSNYKNNTKALQNDLLFEKICYNRFEVIKCQ